MNNIKHELFKYVTNPETWFYWYHNPERLEALYETDTKDKGEGSHIPNEDYEKDDNLNFTKKIWRFEKKDIDKANGIVIQKDLYDFFKTAVLDETRLKKANAFAEYALYISDIEDLAYFRDTVTRREVSAEIDYDRQRDHAGHTVYNYILGWYFFEHSPSLLQIFRYYFHKLLDINLTLEQDGAEDIFYKNNGKFCNIPEGEFKYLITLVNEFGDVWPFASLLHDIGYMLEGSISSASSEVEHARITTGAKIIHDYFNHYFWKVYDIDFRVTHHIAKFLGVLVPDFKRSESLGSLGDHLCDTGTCEHIGEKLKTTIFSGKKQGNQYALSRNAFSIWNAYYEYVGKKQNPLKPNKKMQDILYIVERVFKDNIWVGADNGNRNLDHGVCSGLISLQALLFFRELFLGIKSDNKNFSDFEMAQIDPITFFQGSNNTDSKKSTPVPYQMVSEATFDSIRDGIIKEPKRITIRYPNGEKPDSWFNKVCWATSSAAIHALIQEPDYRKECQKHLEENKNILEENKKKHLKIDLNDDPLAFLGLLVDKLQEWDRYKVKLRGQSAFTGKEPLQSTQIKLNFKSTSPEFTMRYPEKFVVDLDLSKEITNCLNKNDWTSVVKIKKIRR